MTESTSILIRMTPDQKEEIKTQCKEMGITIAEFCKRKLFDPSPADTMNLNELRSSIIKMESRINEISRSCCYRGSIGRTEWQKLLDILNEINTKFDELTSEVRMNNQMNFQKSVEKDHLPDTNQNSQAKSNNASDIFSNPYFDLDNDDLF